MVNGWRNWTELNGSVPHFSTSCKLVGRSFGSQLRKLSKSSVDFGIARFHVICWPPFGFLYSKGLDVLTSSVSFLGPLRTPPILPKSTTETAAVMELRFACEVDLWNHPTDLRHFRFKITSKWYTAVRSLEILRLLCHFSESAIVDQHNLANKGRAHAGKVTVFYVLTARW